MTVYSKPFISIGGFKSRIMYHFSVTIEWKKKRHQKKYGYWEVLFDGTFHMFSIYPIKICWFTRPDLKYVIKNNPPTPPIRMKTTNHRKHKNQT